MMGVGDLDEETAGIVEMIVILQMPTKHINTWILQLEKKMNEICELSGLIGFEVLKKDVETERSLECWAIRHTNHFTEMKGMEFEEVDKV